MGSKSRSSRKGAWKQWFNEQARKLCKKRKIDQKLQKMPTAKEERK